MPERNPPWARDELILALDLYFRLMGPDKLPHGKPEVVELSRILKSLPIHAERPDLARFRNTSGVYMKLSNFLSLDPSYPGRGLERGGKLEQQIWREFHDRRNELRQLAETIRTGYPTAAATPISSEEQDEDDFPEGRVLYRMHRARERNQNLVRLVKTRALKRDGRLGCAACGFDFANTYGRLGEGYIECHHTLPLSSLVTERRTRPDDVALLCSNCHRMVHRRRPWLGTSAIKELLRADGKK
jgi:5-methylcytosine-specific restriction protein A